MYSTGEDNSLACLFISAHKWHIVDDVINNPWNTCNVDEQNTEKPDQPMSPYWSQLSVDKHTDSHDDDEAEEHYYHSFQCWFVEYIVACPWVYKI